MPTQHPASAQQNKEKQHRWLRQTLTVLCLVLLVVVLLAPGALELLYRRTPGQRSGTPGL